MNLQTIIRFANEYIHGCSSKLYKGCDKKKVSREWYERDLKGAFFYGIVCANQEILNTNHREPYEGDELIGELQLLTKEAYEISRKQMKLKIPPLSLERIMNFLDDDAES